MQDFPSKNRVPPLRLLLLISALILIVFPWIPGADEFKSNVVSLKLMAPITMPIVVMLLLLDAVMLAVYREGSDDAQQIRQWGQLMRWNLLGAVLLVVSWIPFFVRLNN